MRFVFLFMFLVGLVCGVISMIAGIDRYERHRRWTSYFNLPTIGSFATAFGVAGYLFFRYTSLSLAAIFGIAIVIGLAAAGGMVALIAGWAVPSAAREVSDARYLLQGHFGRVTQAIPPDGAGEITYEHDGAQHVVAARSLDGAAVASDAEIVIERVEDGVAYVELWSTIERQLKLPT
ncbi:MAG TPA: hypothetical protein VFW98_00915 [Gemmatimonadaceae bacterium]|nr:hypothetical protein [Gemmatimonadaceae bacterium]